MKVLEQKKMLIKSYFNQKSELPSEILTFVKELKNEEVALYSMIDLDESLAFCERWIVLTKSWLMYLTFDNEVVVMKDIKLCHLGEIKEQRALSCSTLIFTSNHHKQALLKVSFTHRQKIMMGHVKYFCDNLVSVKNRLDMTTRDAHKFYQDSVTKPIVDAQNSITTENTQTLWRLLCYLSPYKSELFWGSFGAILTTLVSLVPAYLSGRLIDQVIRPFQDGILSLNEASSIGWTMLIALGLTYVLREFFIFIRLNKMSILGEKVAKDLRKELYSHLQTLSMDFFSKKQTGSIISRVSSDTDRIWDFIAFGVVEVGIAIITLVALSSVLMTLDFQLGLIMALPVPLLLYSIYSHGERMKKLFLKAWRKWSNITAVLSDTIPGMQVVKAFHQEGKEKKRFNDRNEDVANEFNNIHGAWTKFWPVLMLSFQSVIVVVWYFALPRLISIDHESSLSAGTFVSFLLYMTMFSTPIEVLGQVARMLNRALSSAYRIFEILDTNPTIVVKEDAKVIERVRGDVEFKNVFFSYDGIRPILEDLSFNVKEGEMIGLVGSSGGGKSTITKLMTRFYDVQGGSILIDGHEIKDLELGGLRRQIGMVLQEPYLFHGSIFENISYGKPDATKKEIIDAAKVANAHNFIGKLSLGYDTVIGERGHTLSGGERQRVSIARAVLADPKILILDEATSAVDTETERNIQDALDKLVVGRTVFAIAHRLSTLRKADRIFVIGKGSIVEQGTHSELLKKCDGEYAKLHRMQQEMSEEFAL